MVEHIWDQFLAIIKEEAGSRVVETWFKAVTLHHWDALEKKVFLCAPNAFVRNWVQSNYTRLIQTHLARLLNVDEIILIFVGPEDTPDVLSPSVAPVPVVSDLAQVTSTTPVPMKSYSTVNTKYRFETFVVGPSNSLAFAAAQAITERPGLLYNPLFIYGGSGLGKTHLMHAIGNELKEKQKNASILYQPADRFVTEFISAIRFDKVHAFKAKYQTIDVLLIDDIHCISNKEQTQEAFFHIFNALYESHKQIIFSSDTFPQNIHGIAERLRSRLACGLVVDIQIPPLETKIAILKKKAHVHDVVLLDDVAHYIASLEYTNIRELEGALVRVLAFASLSKQPLGLVLAQKVLNRISMKKPVSVDFNMVIYTVLKQYMFTREQLLSARRGKKLAHVRHIVIYLMKSMTNRSFRDIGSYLGGRDHSTVMHAYNKMKNMVELDTSLFNHIQDLKKSIMHNAK